MEDPEASLAWWFHSATSHSAGTSLHTGFPPDPSGGSRTALPPPAMPGVPLGDALTGRASCRRFSGRHLLLDELSTVLDAGYGARATVAVDGLEFECRPVPSAGARYPLEIHLIASFVTGLEPGSYRYLPSGHALERTGRPISPDDVCELFLSQDYLGTASAVAVVTATPGPSLARYGDRGYRYLLFEAGHVAQNLNLACSALGLGSLNLGGFFDQSLTAAMGVSHQMPLYGVALGRASSLEPSETRQPPDNQASVQP